MRKDKEKELYMENRGDTHTWVPHVLFAGVHAQSLAKTQRNKCVWKVEGDFLLVLMLSRKPELRLQNATTRGKLLHRKSSNLQEGCQGPSVWGRNNLLIDIH